MRKILVLIVAMIAALALVGCGSGETARTEPFVGQWESTGGEQIAMTVDAPTDGTYPVRIAGGTVDLSLSAKKSGEDLYEAKPDTGTVWTFRMVDEELLTATAAPKGQPGATTSFKRVGG